MTLTRMNPFSEFDRLSEMLDRVVGAPSQYGAANGGSVLPMDIMEKEGSLVIQTAMPGINPDEIDISIEGDVLSIKGEHRQEEELKEAKIYRREVVRGEMTRSVRLPENLDLEKVEADFNNGMVTITIPRSVEEKPKAIKVPVKGR